MSFLNIVNLVKFSWHLYPGYYADNADNYPVLKLIHSPAADDRGWVCAGITCRAVHHNVERWRGRAMNILPPPWHATTTTTHGEENCPETFHIYFRVISVVNFSFWSKTVWGNSKMVIIIWLETMWVGCREAGTDRATNENCHSPHSDHGRPQYIWNI